MNFSVDITNIIARCVSCGNVVFGDVEKISEADNVYLGNKVVDDKCPKCGCNTFTIMANANVKQIN